MPIDRRGFLRRGAASAVGLAVGAAGVGCATWTGSGEAGPGGFRHGVASGDPLADRVILWTRVTPASGDADRPIEVRWWVAREASGASPVAEGVALAGVERDYTVKVDATGLEPGTDYYYAFEADGLVSPLGRTRTLPPAGVDRVRLAFASCANYPQGFFNAYANLAGRADVDAVLHLGDYLYEYGNGEYGDGTALGRVPLPLHETLTLADYRLRHATYKADPDLQAAHGRHPWITVWDDHESANDSHRRGAENHDPETEGDWEVRRLAAIRAYSEWMPIRELPTGLFRTFRFGDLVDLVMLDTRLHARDAPPPRDEEAANDPERTLLGEDQTGWLLDSLAESKQDEVAWRVVGQQVVVSPMPFGRFGFNPDAWDGYRANRRRILDFVRDEGIEDLVFLTGDVHSTWVFEVPDDVTGERRGLEFVCPAVSSPSIGAALAARGEAGPVAAPEHVVYTNLHEHGYGILDLTRDRVRAEYVYTDPVSRRSANSIGGPAFEASAGSHAIERIDGGGPDAPPRWRSPRRG